MQGAFGCTDTNIKSEVGFLDFYFHIIYFSYHMIFSYIMKRERQFFSSLGKQAEVGFLTPYLSYLPALSASDGFTHTNPKKKC